MLLKLKVFSMSDYRGLIEDMAKDAREAAEATKHSHFPALIQTEDTLKIVKHDEIPIGVSFTVLATAPLTPESVLQTCLKWADREIDKALENERAGN